MKLALENLPRSDWQSVVNPTCTVCLGTGWRTEGSVCLCVWRGVFRSVYAKFRYCAHSNHYKPISIDGTPGPKGRRKGYGIRDAEFMADFCLVAKRTLAPPEYQHFKFHYLLGADWKLCCRRLGMDRGNFFHACYRIERKLGRAFATLQPYALFPVDEYFGGNTRIVDARPLPAPIPRNVNGQPLRPPLAQHGAPTVPAVAPAPCALDPVPVPKPARASLVFADGDALVCYIRQHFRAGRDLRILAADLTLRGVPAPDGRPNWYASDVKRILLNAPRTQRPRGPLKRAA